MKFVPILLLLAALALACGENEQPASVTTSPGATDAPATATPTPAPTATPGATPIPAPTVLAELQDTEVVFVRDPEDFVQFGSLWVGRLDGEGRERLTREGEVAKCAGVATHHATGNETFYYVALDGDLARTMWTLDRETGQRSRLFSFDSFDRYDADAAASPGGRYIAYAHVEGLDLFDTATGTSRRLLDNGPRNCTDVRSCRSHDRPEWSPDGASLLVARTFWEGGATVILDPFGKSVRFYAEGERLGPSRASWSPDGDAICGHTLYDAPSGLFIAETPSWEFQDKLPHYADRSPVSRFVSVCSWLSERLIAFATNVWGPDSDGSGTAISVEFSVYDRQAGEERLVFEESGDGRIWSGEVLALPGTQFAVTQQLRDPEGPYTPEPSRPELVNVETGERIPVLQTGDIVVALAE